jgi:phage shock protein C
MAYKRLYKSETDRKLEGVCAGIADYLDVDPTVVRLIYVMLTFFTGIFPGIIAYIIIAVVTPKESEVKNHGKESN